MFRYSHLAAEYRSVLSEKTRHHDTVRSNLS